MGILPKLWPFRSRKAKQEDVIIAVMGPTGSGKSSFIKTVTGQHDIFVGHGLTSATEKVRSYRFKQQNINYVLVDTPGFNDTNQSDTAIMRKVLEWLETSYRSGVKLRGLIYLHRIIDPRMQGSALRNFRMFRQLCGEDCMGNILLATTFWEEVTELEGAQRENELRNNEEFWGAMIAKGSRIVRIGRDRASSLHLLASLANNQQVTLKAQAEMVLQGKSIEDTSAAQTIDVKVSELKETQDLAVQTAKQKAAQELAAKNALLKSQETQRQLELNRAEKEHQKTIRDAQNAQERIEKQNQRILEEERARQRTLERRQAEERAALNRERREMQRQETLRRAAEREYQRQVRDFEMQQREYERQQREYEMRQREYERYEEERWRNSESERWRNRQSNYGCSCYECSRQARNYW